jgi:hypothetical protein
MTLKRTSAIQIFVSLSIFALALPVAAQTSFYTCVDDKGRKTFS